MAQLQSHESKVDGGDHVYDESIVIPNKSITVNDTLQKRDRFVSSQIPKDLTIQIQDINFTVHKYPLVSKCGYFTGQELQHSSSNFGCSMKLENFPFGTETFEIILKFCYGLPLDLNPKNVAKLRCASEFLEMTEELDDGNLISRTEAFLTFVVLSSWKDTITVLKSCESLSPWAENLQIVRRCCDFIACEAFRESSITADIGNEQGWWIDDVTTLRINHFTRVITSIKAKGAKPEMIGKCVMRYAERWLSVMNLESEGVYGYGKNELHLSIMNGRKEEKGVVQKEQRTIVESLVSLLPSEYGAVSCTFLFKILRMGMMNSASPALISELEKRVGIVLENATADDLLILNYNYEDQGKLTNSPAKCTMYDVDVVQRIVEYFLIYEQGQMREQQRSGKSNVRKLLDNYLAEIAKDPNLSITQFQVIAESMPADSRICDDGLYRAIDTYLKTHPLLSEHDRRKLCKIMNCEKLSVDACTHAAQNDRLSIRTVVQVLFSEQVKMRTALRGQEEAVQTEDNSERENKSTTSLEIKTVKSELDNVKKTMTELQTDYLELQREYKNLACSSNKQRKKSFAGWSSGWRKIKHSFHVKVEADEHPDTQRRSHSSNRASYGRRQSVS
ncbi:hypothetical protein ACFE04_021206 [Oxalis oulophora]